MLSFEKALQLIKDTLASLQRSGLLKADLDDVGSLVLLGSGSPLDSIGFVTFVTELEDRLERETQKELYLVVTDIHDFNTDKANLTGETLAHYLCELAQV